MNIVAQRTTENVVAQCTAKLRKIVAQRTIRKFLPAQLLIGLARASAEYMCLGSLHKEKSRKYYMSISLIFIISPFHTVKAGDLCEVRTFLFRDQ